MRDFSAHNTSCIAAAALAAAFGAAMPVSAAAANNLPSEHTSGAVVFRSGGIGAGESAAMRTAASNYPLEVLFIEREAGGGAHYDAGAHLSIRNASGKQVLSTVADGPFLLARLPAGRYTIEATRNGDAKTRTVTIGPQHVRVVFGWTASHD